MKPSEMTDAKLIAAVAEKVMGWMIGTGLTYKYQGKTVFDKMAGCALSPYTFDPLTDPRHWMMVVERMRKLGFDVSIDSDWNEIDLWRVHFTLHDGKKLCDDTMAFGKCLGRAVCEAAMAAEEEDALDRSVMPQDGLIFDADILEKLK